jgi:hypothetical protein
MVFNGHESSNGKSSRFAVNDKPMGLVMQRHQFFLALSHKRNVCTPPGVMTGEISNRIHQYLLHAESTCARRRHQHEHTNRLNGSD